MVAYTIEVVMKVAKIYMPTFHGGKLWIYKDINPSNLKKINLEPVFFHLQPIQFSPYHIIVKKSQTILDLVWR